MPATATRWTTKAPPPCWRRAWRDRARGDHGGALLEAALIGGAVVGATEVDQAGETAVHAGYLLGTVLLLPLGLLLARDRDGRIAPAPLAVALLALAVVILRAVATA